MHLKKNDKSVNDEPDKILARTLKTIGINMLKVFGYRVERKVKSTTRTIFTLYPDSSSLSFNKLFADA